MVTVLPLLDSAYSGFHLTARHGAQRFQSNYLPHLEHNSFCLTEHFHLTP